MQTIVTALRFEPWSFVPNNPRLPALIYEGAFGPDAADLATLMENRFSENGWPPQWRIPRYWRISPRPDGRYRSR